MEKGVSANRVIVSVLTVLVLVPLAFLTVNSVLMTADIPEPSTEATVFGPDMPWVHLAAAAAVAVLLAVFRGQLARLPEKRLLTVGMTLVFVAGLVWVFTMRVETGADQYFVLEGAKNFLQGDYQAFREGGVFLCLSPPAGARVILSAVPAGRGSKCLALDTSRERAVAAAWFLLPAANYGAPVWKTGSHERCRDPDAPLF